MGIFKSMKITFLLFFNLLFIISCSAVEENIKEIQINDIKIKVEIADTVETRQKGLMNRASIPADQGMLFIFEKEQKMSFWMKNTTIPLSIAYISKSGTIKEIHHMEPLSEKSVKSTYTVLYALEMNQGFFDENGITPGDQVQFLF